jgi:hypothetical protein
MEDNMNNNPISARNVRRSAGAKRVAALWTVAICLLGVGWATVATSGSVPKTSASAAQTAPTVANSALDAGRESLHGSTLAELTTQFWRWLYSIPLGVNPVIDTSGANCGINQEGDVWFLAGPAGTFTETCTIPAGKLIVSGVNEFLDDYPCPSSIPQQPAPGQSLENFLMNDARMVIDGVTHPAAQLDGRSLTVRRIKTRLFSFTAAASLATFDICVTGSPQLAVSDGYFVFIEPLPRGEHVLVLTSVNPDGSNNLGTVHLKIQ